MAVWENKKVGVGKKLEVKKKKAKQRICTCIWKSPVPNNEILWSDGTREDEGEGKHNGEAEEQGQEEDCGPPVGHSGTTQAFFGFPLFYFCCWRCRDSLCTVFLPLQRVALSNLSCRLHRCLLNALLALETCLKKKTVYIKIILPHYENP